MCLIKSSLHLWRSPNPLGRVEGFRWHCHRDFSHNTPWKFNLVSDFPAIKECSDGRSKIKPHSWQKYLNLCVWLTHMNLVRELSNRNCGIFRTVDEPWPSPPFNLIPWNWTLQMLYNRFQILSVNWLFDAEGLSFCDTIRIFLLK